ncbi:MAG: DUF4974 domain-containing protein [Duncaniella sp.]|nr:DUF4974 domain-containing protein [Duncaniella sp.]MDE7476294.1 DUF4974 domain-containing protein [Duncaniella sp.]
MDKQDPKYDLVFDLIEHPENYTSEQLAKILSDPETREFYRLLCLTDSAIEAYKMNIDVDAEWNDFTRKYNIVPPHRFLLFGNRAASIAAIICTSILAVGAGIAVTVSVINRDTEPLGDTNPAEIITTAHTEPSDTSATPADTLTAVSTSVMFENAPLESIMTTIASIYRVEVRFNNREVADLHLYYKLDTTLPLDDILGQLNTFEQINIRRNDNTLYID